MRVIVTGRLKQRSYETKSGEKRTVIELDVEEIGPSLRYATARVERATHTDSGGAGFGGGAGGNRPGRAAYDDVRGGDSWGSWSGSDPEAAPF